MPLVQAQTSPATAPVVDTADAWFSAGDVMNVILVVAAALILWSFYKSHQDKENNFNLLDLIMENGRISIIRFMAIGAWAVYTWAVIRWIITGSVTTADMQSYAASCLAPLVVAIVAQMGRGKEKSDGQGLGYKANMVGEVPKSGGGSGSSPGNYQG